MPVMDLEDAKAILIEVAIVQQTHWDSGRSANELSSAIAKVRQHIEDAHNPTHIPSMPFTRLYERAAILLELLATLEGNNEAG